MMTDEYIHNILGVVSPSLSSKSSQSEQQSSQKEGDFTILKPRDETRKEMTGNQEVKDVADDTKRDDDMKRDDYIDKLLFR